MQLTNRMNTKITTLRILRFHHTNLDGLASTESTNCDRPTSRIVEMSSGGKEGVRQKRKKEFRRLEKRYSRQHSASEKPS